MAISKAKIKFIRSLEQKKQRKELQLFVAEGPKLVDELMGYFDCVLLAATPDWLSLHNHYSADEKIVINQQELKKISALRTPQQVVAVFKQPQYSYEPNILQKELCLALDGVQDPGNLGTIIRLADWFGIEHIFCSQETVDIFNTKTIQASMGGLARVQVHYTDLKELIKQNPDCPIYGTFLEGEDLYQKELLQTGLIIMGNEGQGISPELTPLVSEKLYIPNYPRNKESAESLNVAIATAIVCAEFRRQALPKH